MSYNEVGWLPVRGLGAWPGACINSTSATSVRLSPTLPQSLFLSLSPSPSHPPPEASPLLASSPASLAALLLSLCPPFSSGLFGLLRCPHSALASLRLPASTHQRSVPMRARSRIRRGYDGEESSAIRYPRRREDARGTRPREDAF